MLWEERFDGEVEDIGRGKGEEFVERSSFIGVQKKGEKSKKALIIQVGQLIDLRK